MSGSSAATVWAAFACAASVAVVVLAALGVHPGFVAAAALVMAALGARAVALRLRVLREGRDVR